MTNYLGAEKDLDKAIELDPEYGEAYINRGYAKEFLGKFPAACADWKMAIELGLEEAEKYITECE